MIRLLVSSFIVVAAVAAGATAPHPATAAHSESIEHATPLSAERAGIAIIGTGGAAALDRVTLLDSATGQFIVVTRPICADTCAPLDSASGSVSPTDVARLFALVESEHVFALGDEYDACGHCDTGVSYATTVQANGRRKVITSAGEVTPMLLGRIHVALAEAIRAARGDD